MKNISVFVEHWTGEINSVLSSTATAFSGWLAPVPEAAMTAQAIVKIFELSPVLATLVAASIELVGVSVNAHYLDILEYNENEENEKLRRKRKTYINGLENVKPAKSAVVAFYIVTGAIVGATALYDVVFAGAPMIRALAILFPIASAIGTLTMNRRAALHRKVQRIANGDTATVAEANIADAAIAEAETSGIAEVAERPATVADWRAIVAGLNGKRAELTIEEMQKLLQSNGYLLPSARTQYNWLAETKSETEVMQ